MSTNPAYSLTLLGRFCLRRGDGEEVRLTTKKAEGLLAMLVLAGPPGSSRVQLQADLWPHSPLQKQQTNLRQALQMLKRVVGEDLILVSRDRCRLGKPEAIDCDVLNRSIEGGSQEVFLPEMSEPWFQDQRRRRRASDSATQVPGSDSGPIADFFRLLKWATDHDPVRAVDLLRSHQDLAVGVPNREMREAMDVLLSRLNPAHSMYGWALYWKAACTVQEDLIAALPLMSEAVKRGISQNDSLLQIAAGYWLGAIQITLGDLARASKTSKACFSIAERSGEPLLRSRAASLHGTLMMHLGSPEEGISWMRQAKSGFESSALELACHDALTSLYLATMGLNDEAATLLEGIDALARGTHHFYLDTLRFLSGGVVATNTGELDYAGQQLHSVLRIASDSKSSHFEIYAHESLAMVAHRSNDAAGTGDRIAVARAKRRDLSMAYTAWDHLRLAGLRQR